MFSVISAFWRPCARVGPALAWRRLSHSALWTSRGPFVVLACFGVLVFIGLIQGCKRKVTYVRPGVPSSQPAEPFCVLSGASSVVYYPSTMTEYGMTGHLQYHLDTTRAPEEVLGDLDRHFSSRDWYSFSRDVGPYGTHIGIWQVPPDAKDLDPAMDCREIYRWWGRPDQELMWVRLAHWLSKEDNDHHYRGQKRGHY